MSIYSFKINVRVGLSHKIIWTYNDKSKIFDFLHGKLKHPCVSKKCDTYLETKVRAPNAYQISERNRNNMLPLSIFFIFLDIPVIVNFFEFRFFKKTNLLTIQEWNCENFPD